VPSKTKKMMILTWRQWQWQWQFRERAMGYRLKREDANAMGRSGKAVFMLRENVRGEGPHTSAGEAVTCEDSLELLSSLDLL
jgi:hypothetical protein